MTNPRTPPQLPHHRLVAYQVAVELLLLIKGANIRDAKLRDEALRAAKSAVLNIAEGVGRLARADKTRAFRSLAARGSRLSLRSKRRASSATHASDVERCLPLAQRLYALLTGLMRCG